MCLKVQRDAVMQCDEANDIEVFKVVVVRHGRLESPYQSFPYNVGETLYSELVRLNTIDGVNFGLHTLASLKDAHKLVNAIDFRLKPTILRCIIPAGSSYYEGTWKFWPDVIGTSDTEYLNGIEVVSYASRVLRVVEEVK